MAAPNVQVPKKWWWVVAVAVPLIGGAFAVSPELIALFTDTASPPPISDRVVVRESTIQGSRIVGGDLHEGDNVRTQIALSFQTAEEKLSPEERATLERALDRLKAGDYEGAIPVLKAISQRAPSASLLNNLAAAHLAVGETAAAREAIVEARALEGESDLDLSAALNWNERRRAQTRAYGKTPITETHATRWEGIEAYLTRADDTGGMVTVEGAFRNSSTGPVSFCPIIYNAYVIDERSGEKWDDSFYSHVNCTIRLEPGATFPFWLKFAFGPAEHPRVTLILPGVLPFEGLEPAMGGRG